MHTFRIPAVRTFREVVNYHSTSGQSRVFGQLS
jgi:hypothetical protein